MFFLYIVVPSIGVVNPQSSQMLLFGAYIEILYKPPLYNCLSLPLSGSTISALIVTLLVFVLVVMVVVCVVVKRNRRKKNNTLSDCNRQGSEEILTNQVSSYCLWGLMRMD